MSLEKIENIFWILLIIFMILWGFEEYTHNIKCRDAGGIPVDTKCINPGAIIEVD
jgi:hypothetical protein